MNDYDEDHRERLPALIDYFKAEAARREDDQGAVHFHFHEAERPAPPAPPPPDILARHIPFMLVCFGWISLAGLLGVVLIFLAPMIMTVMISLAVCAVAGAAAARSLRTTAADARREEDLRDRERE